MKNPRRKKRGLWIDISLICAIILLSSFIIYFTVMAPSKSISQTSASVLEEESLQVTTQEVASSIAGVTTVKEVANHSQYPFEIQYPKTKYTAVNTVISSYIESVKEAYISNVRVAQASGETITGQLRTSLQLYNHQDQYISVVLTTTEAIPNSIEKTLLQTYLIDNETGDLVRLASLFNHDEKGLDTFASHIQTELVNAKIADATTITDHLPTNWASFEHFAIDGENLVLYFTQHELPELQVNVSVLPVSLSYLNPLLAADFQIEMVEVEQPVQTTEPTATKHIALTFDDGPHQKVTPQILNILDKYNAKATFFVLGNRVTQTPEIVKDAYQRGHEIGNHTWSHPKLPTLSAEQIRSEYNSTEQAIMDAISQPSTIFRPPYGLSNDFVKGVLTYPTVNWTIDTEDWKYRDANMLLPMINKDLANNGIILMHDIHQSTADGLESVLAYLQAEGYEFVTVSEILQYH